LKVWEVSNPVFVKVLPDYRLTRVRELLRKKEARIAVIISDIASNKFGGYVGRREAIMLTSMKSDREVREYAKETPVLYRDMSIEEAIKILRENNVYAAPVLYSRSNPQVIGVLSLRDIIRALKSVGYVPKAKVAGEVMTTDNLTNYIIDQNREITEVWSKFVYDNVKALVVTQSSNNPRPVGIVTPKDLIDTGRWYFRREAENIVTSPAKVRSIMTRGVIVANIDTPIEEIANYMIRYDFSLIPVVDKDGKIVGVVTQEDVIRAYLEGIKPGRVPIPVAPPPLPVPATESPTYISSGEALSQVLVKTKAPKVSALTAGEVSIPNFPAVRIDNTIEHVLKVMLRNRVNQVIVVDKEGRIVGSVSKRNLLYSIGIKGPLWKRRPFDKEFIWEVINENVPIVRESAPIEEVARQMILNDSEIAVVVDKEGVMTGVVTKDTLINAIKETDHANLKVENVIVPLKLSIVHPHHSLAHAVRKMKAYYLDALTVAEGNIIKGVVTENKLPFLALEDSRTGIKSRRLIWIRRLERGGRPLGRYIKVTPLLVEDAMTPLQDSVKISDRVSLAVEKMREYDADGIPVTDDEGTVLGVLCKYDLLRSLARSAPSLKEEWIAKEARVRGRR